MRDMKSLQGIQTIRGLIANIVVIYHCFQIGLLPKYGFSDQFDSMSFLNNAPPVVDLFICISGFIIFYGYSNSSKSGIEFFKSRLIRIIPTYWLVSLLVFLANSLMTSVFDFKFLIQSLTFTVDLNDTYPLLASGWTLQYIMLFYLLFSIALLFESKFRLLFVSVILLLLVLLDPSNIITSTSIIIEFSVGGLAYYFYKSPKSDKYHKSFIVASILFILFTLTFSDQSFFHQNRGVIFAIPNFLIVVHMAKVKVPKYSLQLAGQYSFTLYLIHFPLLSLFFKISEKFLTSPIPGWVYISTFAVACNVIAYFFWKYIEIPLTSFVKSNVTLSRRYPSTTK